MQRIIHTLIVSSISHFDLFCFSSASLRSPFIHRKYELSCAWICRQIYYLFFFFFFLLDLWLCQNRLSLSQQKKEMTKWWKKMQQKKRFSSSLVDDGFFFTCLRVSASHTYAEFANFLMKIQDICCSKHFWFMTWSSGRHAFVACEIQLKRIVDDDNIDVTGWFLVGVLLTIMLSACLRLSACFVSCNANANGAIRQNFFLRLLQDFSKCFFLSRRLKCNKNSRTNCFRDGWTQDKSCHE